ncbi:XRE family transcriptional regulator [Companilactobacillus sp. DQM5]|uniref:XRE family transcriptional regulator n=1 Tax=Companilactobacillus sp. DQM5 TaxID=3463359 RepID=UPI00405A11CB
MQYEVDLNFLRKRRKELGLSSIDMSKALKLKSPDKYLRRESGVYRFQSNEIPTLAYKLEIPIEKIFKKNNAKIAN